MSGDDHHFQAIDLLELVGFGICRTGHAGQLVVHAEIILEGNGSHRLVLFLYLHAFFGFHRLVQAVRPATPGHGSAGKLVYDNNLAIVDDVFHVDVEQVMGTQGRGQVMHQFDVARVVKTLAFLEQTCLAKQLLNLGVTVFGKVGLLALLVDCEVAGLDDLGNRRLGSRLHFHQVGVLLGRLLQGLVDWHLAQGLAVHVQQLNLAGHDVFIAFRIGTASLESQLGDNGVHAYVQIRALFRGSGNNQGGTRFIDQDGVDLIHYRKGLLALNTILGTESQVVAQVVESEFVIGAVGDISRVGCTLRLGIHACLDDSNAHTQEFVDRRHPPGVTRCQVFIHGNNVHAV